MTSMAGTSEQVTADPLAQVFVASASAMVSPALAGAKAAIVSGNAMPAAGAPG